PQHPHRCRHRRCVAGRVAPSHDCATDRRPFDAPVLHGKGSMTNWIDDVPPYPWHLPLARDLQKRLVNTFYEPVETRQLIQRAGAPDWTKVAFNGGPFQIWVDILERAGAEGSLRTLLEYIAGEAKASKTLATFIKALLEAENVPADPSPGDKTGPDFPSDVTREQAL